MIAKVVCWVPVPLLPKNIEQQYLERARIPEHAVSEAARKSARVSDYKTGKVPKDLVSLRLKGGTELQRCLYSLNQYVCLNFLVIFLTSKILSFVL